MSSTQVKILVPGNHLMVGLLGQRDELLRTVEAAFDDTRIHVRGNEITVEGPEAERVGRLFEELVVLLQQGHWLDPTNVGHTIEMVKDDVRPSEVYSAEAGRSARGRKVHPKTAGQKRYVDAIAANTITFGIGPAGTGKSYLAVALAVQALQAKEVARIIFDAPGGRGGREARVPSRRPHGQGGPLSAPAYDALYDMLEPEGTQRLLERGTIEVAPLAFMRGRTLNGSFVILDEAQNTTPEQMKMFLTRIGFGTRVVVTGDVTQIDVAGGRSGLLGLEELLGEIDGISFVHLGQADVVRHRIVREIVSAYDRSAKARSIGSGVVRTRLADLGPEDAEGPGPRTARVHAPADAPPRGRRGDPQVFAADEQSERPVDLARWVGLAEKVLGERGVGERAELSLMFVDEASIASLNDRFLGRKGPTDVLSFPIEDELIGPSHVPDPELSGPGRGPLEPRTFPSFSATSSSAPRSPARRGPSTPGTYEDELALLLVHGILHLLGMDHSEDAEAAEMEALEQHLLASLHHGAGEGS